ncbi:Nucleoprotein TPR [Vanrija pseudolonga]|uniref:Nucleoprotein TPR n=1 Tax=Vanrija pseudolonga TaxID=143232 RepID=A0AAF0Y160_9TREE|nr:Nucleoprotein TPR [Vanrija pseudolonga]
MSEGQPAAGATIAAEPAAAPASSELASVSVPADLVADVEREQALADLHSSLKSRSDDVDKLNADKQQLITERDGAVSTANQLRAQLSSLQSTHLQSTSELGVVQSRIEAAEREKRELLEEIQRLQERSHRATQDLYTLRSQKSEASQKIAHLDVEVSELKMAADSAKFNEERSVQALKNARSEILTTSKAATDAEARFSKYRAQTQSELSQLQHENETVQSRITSIQTAYQSLQRTYEDQARRLAEAHANIATLTSASASQKTSYRLEFDRLHEEIRLAQRHGDEARTEVADREAELERLSESLAEKEGLWEDRWKREERARKEAEKRVDDLKVVVERLAMAQGEGSGSDISPAATLATKLREEGKSYTQFYTDYTIQEGKLRASQDEVARLTSLLEQISQDIAEKKPLFEQQAQEHGAAIERANALATELASAISARDNFESRAKALDAASTHHAEEVQSLETTAKDLSRQVQGLLREISIRDDPSLANVAFNEKAKVIEGDIVTDRLLEFTSLPTLQQQNQRLLKLTRALAAKLDAREINRATNHASDVDTGAALDQATETITRLHTQVLESQKKINEISRERDLFSKLLARGEGLRWSANGTSSNGPLETSDSSNEQALATLQAQLSSVRDKADADVAEAKELARQKSEAAGVAEVERVKAEARATMIEKQHQILNETHQLQKQEYASLETQYRQVQSQISQAESERRAALEEVANHQSTEARLRDEAANLRAEREQWESVQSRMQTDFSTVQQERVRLQHLIDNLNSVSTENERTRTEERTRLERRIDELQREATQLRNQADEAREAVRAAERRLEETDQRIQAETATITAAKEAAEKIVAEKDQEITGLKEQADKNLKIGLNWQRRAKELQERNATVDAKEAEITKLKAELTEAQAKVAELEKKVSDAEQASSQKDTTVQGLQAELAKAKEAPASAAPAADPAELTALQAERDALQQKLTQAESELAAAKAAVSEAAPATPATPADTATPAAVPEGETPSVDTAALQTQLDEATKKLADQETRYQNDVIKVNRANQGLSNRVKAFTAEKAALDAKITELEKEVAELKVKLATAEASAGTATTDQSAIEEAVKTAVAAREAELNAAHAAVLANAGSKPDDSAIQAAVSAKETELKAAFDKELAEAKAQAPAGNEELVAKNAEQEKEIKTLQRQIRTGEITRKTLERQKTDLETKVRNLEAAAAGSPAPSLSAAAAPFKPAAAASPAAEASTPPASLPAKPSPTAPAPAAAEASTSAATADASVRGGAAGRGRGRGAAAAVRGRGAAPARPNSVLNAVNATLASATDTSGGTKRAAPDDDGAAGATTTSPDILARLQNAQPGAAAEAAAPAEGATRGRAAKRARGGAARGRGTGRRPSGAGGAGGDA